MRFSRDRQSGLFEGEGCAVINGAVTGGRAETFCFSSSERTWSFWSSERQMEVMQK